MTPLWKRGSERRPSGPVHVSMNDYWVARRDAPAVARAGLRLRRGWRSVPGAVAVAMAAGGGGRRQISVSVWREPADLAAFVRSPVHRAVMERFRDTGSLTTTAWTAPRYDRRAIWRQAREHLRSAAPR